MVLLPFDEQRLPELMHWFGDADACRAWGGPHFRFPYTAATFREDSAFERLPTWALLDGAGSFVAFGQYYSRVGRCHLGRLAVAPDARNRGIGTRLIRALCTKGAAALVADEFSLFVLERNAAAARLYLRLGFEATTYPEPLPASEPMRYMVASGPAAAALRDAWPTPAFVRPVPNCE